MAKKSFILSNNDGWVTFSNIESASIDDGTSPSLPTDRGHISASNLYIENSYTIRSIQSFNNYRILSSSNGQFLTSSIAGGAGLSGALAYNGTSSVLTNILNPSDYDGLPIDQTYLSGSYRGNVKVLNVNTVSSGSLKPSYGGTGLSGSQYVASTKLILKGSGSLPNEFSVLSASIPYTIITSGENRFNVQYPSYIPDVRFYGTPGTYTWKRPIGARFARVILQGAGGGGGGGRVATAARGGQGGASGGFSDIILDISNFNSCSVIVGAGGLGGASNNNGINGGNTSFIADNTYSSTGGSGGTWTVTSVRSIGGVGLTKNGGGGGANNLASLYTAETVYGMPSGGGKGYDATSGPATAGGTIIPIISSSNKNFGYNTTNEGLTVTTTLMSGGAGAANISVSGDNGGIGAGGGGGASPGSTGVGTNGGRGGDGYALIISW